LNNGVNLTLELKPYVRIPGFEAIKIMPHTRRKAYPRSLKISGVTAAQAQFIAETGLEIMLVKPQGVGRGQ
jgi:hypothetical protein